MTPEEAAGVLKYHDKYSATELSEATSTLRGYYEHMLATASGLKKMTADMALKLLPQLPTSAADPSGPSQVEGDDQTVHQSGANKNQQQQDANTEQTTQVQGDSGGSEVDAGRNSSVTTISPIVTPTASAAPTGEAQSASMGVANSAATGQQHQQLVSTYDVQGPTQNVSAPVYVDMTRSALAQTSTSTAALIIVAVAGVLTVWLARPKQPRAPRPRGGRHAR